MGRQKSRSHNLSARWPQDDRSSCSLWPWRGRQHPLGKRAGPLPWLLGREALRSHPLACSPRPLVFLWQNSSLRTDQTPRLCFLPITLTPAGSPGLRCAVAAAQLLHPESPPSDGTPLPEALGLTCSPSRSVLGISESQLAALGVLTALCGRRVLQGFAYGAASACLP